MSAHLPLAFIMQGLAFLLVRLLGAAPVPAIWLGCFCAIAVCVTREITQAEYQWIEYHGGGLRRNMPRLAGYRFWQWNRHSRRETLAAAILTIAIAALISVSG